MCHFVIFQSASAVEQGHTVFTIVAAYCGEDGSRLRNEVAAYVKVHKDSLRVSMADFFTEIGENIEDYVVQIAERKRDCDELCLWVVAKIRCIHVGVLNGRVEGDWCTAHGLSIEQCSLVLVYTGSNKFKMCVAVMKRRSHGKSESELLVKQEKFKADSEVNRKAAVEEQRRQCAENEEIIEKRERSIKEAKEKATKELQYQSQCAKVKKLYGQMRLEKEQDKRAPVAEEYMAKLRARCVDTVKDDKKVSQEAVEAEKRQGKEASAETKKSTPSKLQEETANVGRASRKRQRGDIKEIAKVRKTARELATEERTGANYHA